MEKERLQKYADTILKGYLPLNEHYARFEIENNIHKRKIEQVHSLIMSVPMRMDDAIKVEIADNAVRKLKDAYGMN